MFLVYHIIVHSYNTAKNGVDRPKKLWAEWGFYGQWSMQSRKDNYLSIVAWEIPQIITDKVGGPL